jgi:hypothetical protein
MPVISTEISQAWSNSKNCSVFRRCMLPEILAPTSDKNATHYTIHLSWVCRTGCSDRFCAIWAKSRLKLFAGRKDC